jgi:hypothetical protein
MSTQQRQHFSHRVSDQIAELVMEASSGRVPDGHALLAGLLAAAAAPGRPVELSGEQACLVAFRATQPATGAGSGRLSIVKTTMLRMLTVKAALAAVAAAGGGLALAAGTGVVDNPLDGALSPGSSDRSVAHSPAQYVPSRQPSGDPQRSQSATESASGAPEPQAQSLLALCRTYQAGDKAERGKAFDSPAFSGLIAAAGGQDKVDQFCDAQLAAPPNTTDSAPPGKNHRTGPPNNPTGDHPTGKPTSHPGPLAASPGW